MPKLEEITDETPRNLAAELRQEISAMEALMGPLPESFHRAAMMVMNGAGLWRMGGLDLAAVWYRLGFQAAQEVPAQTMGELRLVYAVPDEIQGQVALTIRGPRETVQAMAPMFSRPLTVVARDGGLWISPVQAPEAPEVPQNPTHKPTHGSTP